MSGLKLVDNLLANYNGWLRISGGIYIAKHRTRANEILEEVFKIIYAVRAVMWNDYIR
jgi:hypothetical protein